jgi:hypothetical protein
MGLLWIGVLIRGVSYSFNVWILLSSGYYKKTNNE